MSEREAFVHESAVVDAGAEIGAGARLWHGVHVCRGARIGEDVSLGQGVYVGPDVRIGRGSKIQNHVSVYAGVELGEGVFVGPSAVFTNVRTPRAHVSRKDAFARTRVGRHATIGANATVICGVSVGERAFVGAGAVVTKDVPPGALVLGTPARIAAWVCDCGEVLRGDSPALRCDCGLRWRPADHGGVEPESPS